MNNPQEIMLKLCTFFLFFTVSVLSIRPDDRIEGHELLNKCLEAQNHKAKPGPEDNDLRDQCKPWTNRSCCTEDTASLIHLGSLYNFRYDHCANLSAKCKQHFTQEHCFFECTPNGGPWIVKVTGRKSRNESFFHMPLCRSECQNWFEDCKQDLTCTDNWTQNFDWKKIGNDKKKTNVCPNGATCETFEKIYQTAENFCQRIWDDAWQVVPDEQDCMKIWFDGSKGNPNDEVAKRKVQALINGPTGDNVIDNDASISMGSIWLVLTVTSVWVLFN